MLDPLITLVISVGFSLLFLAAARHKLSGFAQFTQILADYQLLPASLVRLAAWLVTGVEVALSMLWIAGLWLPLLNTFTALTSAALLTLYACAVGINLLRGRVHISCGCGIEGSNNSEHPLSPGIVFRNGILSLFALMPLLSVVQRDLYWFDYVAALTALLSAVLLYAALSQLLSNATSLAVWRTEMEAISHE